MSGVDFLDKLLDGVEVEWTALGSLARIGTGSSNRQDESENGIYPFYVRSKSILKSDTFEFDEEAIVIPGEGGIGDIFHYAKGKYALHQRAYPSSPILANAVMINIDGDLQALINSNPEKFGRACLTRYADDFVFSTDKAGACKSFVDEMRKLLMKTNSPRLKINDAKTRFMSRPGGSTLVTGLRINQFGGVRVHPDYRDHVRLLLKHFANGTLKRDEHRVLVGHLAHVEHADPQLFTRLSYKYFAEIARIRGG